MSEQASKSKLPKNSRYHLPGYEVHTINTSLQKNSHVDGLKPLEMEVENQVRKVFYSNSPLWASAYKLNDAPSCSAEMLLLGAKGSKNTLLARIFARF